MLHVTVLFPATTTPTAATTIIDDYLKYDTIAKAIRFVTSAPCPKSTIDTIIQQILRIFKQRIVDELLHRDISRCTHCETGPLFSSEL